MLREDAGDFIFHSSIGIQGVPSDGIIEYANQFELDVLGYSKEEYVGHHVSEFQLDKACLSDMMCRLGRFESLKNYPAKVQAKHSKKYILYNSSVYQQEGRFIHSRCFGSEIEEAVYMATKGASPYSRSRNFVTGKSHYMNNSSFLDYLYARSWL